MLQKRMFKVLSPVDKRGGGKYWMRLGTAFLNKDDSINIYLDALPKNAELQLREMTEEDFARNRESSSSMASSSLSSSSLSSSRAVTSMPSASDGVEAVPF